MSSRIPITIITGFLGSGKTTLLLNLIPQLPPTYKLALLKNEFGDLAIDSQLASSSSIAGVQELLNGCICCNLVGQLGDALDTLRTSVKPNRIVIETSGSAFPATLAMEVNRLARETGHYVLDGVVGVIDVENWKGYEDTSYTAKMQAQYTDLIVLNKWENVDERTWDICLDRLADLDVDTPHVKSDRGSVGKDIILGLDGALARELGTAEGAKEHKAHVHDDTTSHQSEVEVLSVTLSSKPASEEGRIPGIDLEKLETFLLAAPKDEIYRIKAVLYASSPPASSSGDRVPPPSSQPHGTAARYILNWAFGRWTFTLVAAELNTAGEANGTTQNGILQNGHTPFSSAQAFNGQAEEPTVRMTIVCGRFESDKWKKRIEGGQYIAISPDQGLSGVLTVERIS